MPSKKQRRRRDKARRHEYEYVVVDETGTELEVEPAELKKKDVKPAAAKRGTRSGRVVQPPSWQRAAKRAVFFAPILVILLSFGKNPPPLPLRIIAAIAYSALFVPTFYWVDRLAYRSYQKRLQRS